MSLEQIKPLIIVLGLALPALWFGRVAFSTLMDKRELIAYAACWSVVTASAFLIGNIWLYLVVLCLLIFVFSIKTSLSGTRLFMLLLCAVPFFEKDIPGFGALEHLLTLSHYKVLALACLLPVFWQSPSRPGGMFFKLTDIILLTLFFFSSVLVLRETTLTDTMRSGLDAFLVMVLPYLAFSRGIGSIKELRETMIAFVLSFLALSLIGQFEFWKWWHLYDSIRIPWETIGDGYGYLE